MRFSVFLTLVLISSSSVWAVDRPSDLKKKTSAQAKKTKAKAAPVLPELKKYDFDHPFLLRVYIDIGLDPKAPEELKAWTRLLGEEEYEDAAIGYFSLVSRMPEKYKKLLEATQAYLYYRLDFHQLFVNQYLRLRAFRADPLFLLLNQVFEDVAFEAWFFQTRVVLNAEQRALLGDGADKKTSRPILFLKAIAALRDPKQAQKILNLLHVSNPVTYDLAKTVAFQHIKKNDLKSAARVLKAEVEPYLESQKDENLWAEHHLMIARLLYQSGALESSELFYLKIPRGAENYLVAQEELTWVYLRLGKLEELRGTLITLSSDVFESRFQPEVYVVRAISNLKLCYYSDVLKDFELFISRNAKFSKEIDAVMEKGVYPEPPSPDRYVRAAARTSLDLQQEKKRLMEWFARTEDKTASGARGVAMKDLGSSIELGFKQLQNEYRRSWKARRATLLESMKKMMFVRVELLSELAITSVTPLTQTGKKEPNKEALKKEKPGAQIYPFEDVIWSDELFKLKSFTKGKCLGQ